MATDNALGTDDDVHGQQWSGDPCVSLDLRVAVRDIYILQTVSGDAGDGTGRYTLSQDSACTIPSDLPGFPPGLMQRTSGGIMTTPSVTVVELRKGYFNITGAVLSPVDEIPGFDPAKRFALNHEADECTMSTKLTNTPEICTIETNPVTADMVRGVDAKGRAIMHFVINCEAAVDDAADDAADMDDDAADMDDAAADDAADDDAMDSGPAMDTPTG